MASIDATHLDEILATAAANGTVPGIVAVAADRDGVIYEGTAGAGADTMFRIASMTKALTSATALTLLDEGRIELEQTVASVIPAFGELQVLDGFDGDSPCLRPPASQATIRQLLTHTSGLGYFFVNEDLRRYHEVTGLSTELAVAGTLDLFTLPLTADPGTIWQYGTNTDWLGRVVEEVTGQTLDVAMRERIFEPLGMTDATFSPTDAQLERTMGVHDRTADGGLTPSDIDLPESPPFAAGGHGVYATAGDYARFLRAMLRGGELDGTRILREETVEAALSPQIGAIALPEIMRTSEPRLSNDVLSLPIPQTWGLGFHLVLEDVPGMRRAGTGDWAGLFNSYYWIDRAAGVAAATFTQVLPFFDGRIIEMAMAFEAALYAEVGAPAAA